MFQALQEQGAVGQSGEVVVGGLVLQLGLDLLAAGDVLDVVDDVGRSPVRAGDDRGGVQDAHDRSVEVHKPGLVLVLGEPAVQQGLPLAPARRDVLGVHHLVDPQVRQLRLGAPEQSRERLVDLHEATVRIRDGHPDRGVVEGAAEALAGEP